MVTIICPQETSNRVTGWDTLKLISSTDDDVIDGDVDELDEEPDEAHDAEADGGGDGDLGELLPVGLGAALDQPDGVLGKLLEGLQGGGDLVHPGKSCSLVEVNQAIKA